MPSWKKKIASKNLQPQCSETTTFPSEHDEQVGFVNWWRVRFPGVLLFAVPNGGHRAMSVAKSMKAEGVMPGIPDMHAPALKLWIEMKRVKGGKLSADQVKMIAHLESIGHTVIVGHGARDASEKVLAHLKKTKDPR